MLACFKIIKERLKENGYDRIQYLPSRKSLAIGKEFYVFRSFFYQKAPCLFHSTCFYTLYHLIFKKRHPQLYSLYKICFMNEPTEKEILLNFFSADEIGDFIKNGIVKCEGRNYWFNFRLVPYEELFIVAKVDMKDPEYAHINYDSVTFLEFLRKMRFAKNFKKALEIGCGAGLISIEIARNADKVDSVDISPYAVKAMDINAKLNDVSNITPFISNCYDNIKEKYDFIVSDPPFELMPEEEKNVLHRCGGFLGMEIALKIFAGLDEHLANDGEAVVFTNSYIKNFKVDTLKDALYDMFDRKNFCVTLYRLSYQITPEFYPVYRKNNITHSIGYFIHIKRAKNFTMDIVPLSFLNKIKEILRLLYLYIIILLKR